MTATLNPTEKYIDLTLNDQNFSLLSLSVQLSLKEFSFCINNQEGRCFAVESYSFSEKLSITDLNLFINELFQQESLFQHEYMHVFVSYKHSHASLIPAALFDAGNLTEYLSLIEDHPEEQTHMYDYISESDAYNVYIFPQQLYQSILSRFPLTRFIHHSTVFIKSIYFTYPSITENKVFVNVNNNEFELCIFKKSGLQLYNTFQFKTKEDLLYLLLFVMKHLGCDPSQHQVLLSGKIADDSAVYQLLYKYIKDIGFTEMKQSEAISTLLKDVAAYYYFTLLNLRLCVS